MNTNCRDLRRIIFCREECFDFAIGLLAIELAIVVRATECRSFERRVSYGEVGAFGPIFAVVGSATLEVDPSLPDTY